MRRRHLATALAVPVLLLAACDTEVPTSGDEGDTPTDEGQADVPEGGGTGVDPGDGTSEGVEEAGDAEDAQRDG